MVVSRKFFAPLLLASCWISSVQCFTGLSPLSAAVQRGAVPHINIKHNAINSAAVRARCSNSKYRQHVRYRSVEGVVMKAAVEPVALDKNLKVQDPYEVEAGLVKEDKAV